MDHRFLVEEGFEPDGFHIKEGHPAPTLEELKIFIRLFIASTKGRIDDNPTMKSVLIRAQEFVPGFYIKSGNRITSHDTEQLYYVRARYPHTSTPLTCSVD